MQDDIANRKAAIRGLRKWLQHIADQPWPSAGSGFGVYDLLDHVGRTGQPVPDALVGAEPDQSTRPA